MTPTPLPSGSGSGEVWHNEPATLGGVINMDLLMPNGLLIPVNCPTDRTLAALKVDLFVEAKKYPLYDRLLAPTDYIFYTVALSGEKEEFYDESRTIDSLRLFVPVLRLVEPEGNREEKQLAHDIGVAIGHPLSEVEHGLNSETEAARLQLYRIVESSVKERRNPETNADMYAFPEDLTSDSYPLPSTSDCLIAVWMKSAHNVGAKEGGQKMTIKCDLKTTTPDDLLRLALKGRYQRAHPVSADLMQQCSSQYVLKAVGLRLYLTNAVPLCRFRYIRSCLEKKTTPLLMMMSREAVLKETAVTWELIPPSWIRARGGTQDDEFNLPQASSLWKNQDMFKVRIHSASHINVTDVDLIYVKAAIFHGPDMIISRDSKKVTPSNPRWSDSWIEYDFFVPDIPPSAQICFSVVSVKIRKT
uniref:Uncharacterized protein n=1 Tax=Plectus sambesii TaxID=2011161 RepID=A0A914X219_9BILA